MATHFGRHFESLFLAGVSGISEGTALTAFRISAFKQVGSLSAEDFLGMPKWHSPQNPSTGER
jgi:hypothetical protein